MTLDRLRARDVALAVAAVAVAVYINSLWNGFAYDDFWIIQNNPHVFLHQLGRIWTLPYWPQSGKELGLYRPLTIFLFAIEWLVGHGHAWVFHLVTVLGHGLASALVFLLLDRLTSRPGAFFGGLVFAVHPVHVEAVANVVGQAEVVSAAAVLAACLLYLSRPTGTAVSVRRALAIAGLYAVGLCAKEGAIVLPGLLVLLDFAQRRVPLHRSAILRYAGDVARPVAYLALVALLFLTARVLVLGSLTGTNAGPGLGFLRTGHRVLTAFRAWPEYVRLLFFPADLSADYSPAVILPVTALSPLTILGCGLLLLVILLALATPRRPDIGFAPAWFFISILPVSNLLFPIGVVVAERTLYLPSVAAAAVAAFGWDALRRRHEQATGDGAPEAPPAETPALPSEAPRPATTRPPRRRAAIAAAALILALGAARTIARNPVWHDTNTLMKNLLREHPESFRAQWTAAIRAIGEKDIPAAELHWRMAYALWPGSPQMLEQYGIYLYRSRRAAAAIPLFRRAHRLEPDASSPWVWLAMAQLADSRFADAVGTVDSAAIAGHRNATLVDTRARALAELGREPEAIAAFRAVLRLPHGDRWDEWYMLARTFSKAGRPDRARVLLDTARLRAHGDTAADRVIAGAYTVLDETGGGQPDRWPPPDAAASTPLDDLFPRVRVAPSAGARLR